jgi:5-methylcytosine-specific restriction endonuclease McrA
VARIRSIKPDFWDDDAVGALSRDARLLFVATWTFADDEGLVRWSPSYLKASAFMYDDDITENDIQKWMSELEESGFVFSYATGRVRQRTGFIINFRKHQRIDKPQPGKLPPPPCDEPEVILMYARRDLFTCHLCGEPVNREMAVRPGQNVYDPDRPPDLTGRNPSPDHLIPRSQGGSDYPTNIRTSHVSCNKGRGSRSLPKPKVKAPKTRSKNPPRTVPGTVPEEVAERSATDRKGLEGMGEEGMGDTEVAVVNSSVEGVIHRPLVQLPTGPWLSGSKPPEPHPPPPASPRGRRETDAERRRQAAALAKWENENTGETANAAPA